MDLIKSEETVQLWTPATYVLINCLIKVFFSFLKGMKSEKADLISWQSHLDN